MKQDKNAHFNIISQRKRLIIHRCLFWSVMISAMSVWQNCLAISTLLAPVYPTQVGPHEILLRGAEICPNSLMAVNTQLSPSGDVLVWCAAFTEPSTKENTSTSLPQTPASLHQPTIDAHT